MNKFSKIYNLKLSYKNSCVKFDSFSKRNDSLIFHPKGSAQKQKCEMTSLQNFTIKETRAIGRGLYCEFWSYHSE